MIEAGIEQCVGAPQVEGIEWSGAVLSAQLHPLQCFKVLPVPQQKSKSQYWVTSCCIRKDHSVQFPSWVWEICQYLVILM